MRNIIKSRLLPLRKLAQRFVNLPKEIETPIFIASRDSIIYKAASFAAVNKIQGDYLEFGVFKGDSFIPAYYTMRHCFEEVLQDLGSTMSDDDRKTTECILKEMRFFAFDSFDGLPRVVDSDVGGFFKKGQFKASLDVFSQNLRMVGFPEDRLVVVKGWYDESLTQEVYDQYSLKKAAIVHIDCDLFESTRVVLEFLGPVLIDGTILIFDDWFHFNGHPLRGERRAFEEWSANLSGWSFTEYQLEGAWRKSFIANKL